MSVPASFRKSALALGVLAASLTAPAMAASAPSTRLVSCRASNCLVVSGHRDSAASIVMINGHAVSAQGGRNWQIRLPLETVRAWSDPFARTIEVSTFDPATQVNTASTAHLPIGLLGSTTTLASLVISAK